MKKLWIVLLASLIGMLLCSGVALAGNCCFPIDGNHDHCCCGTANDEADCEGSGGIWVGSDGCTGGVYCPGYCTVDGKCVPEMSTIALLATGLICMAGYFRLRRKEE